MAQQQYHLVEEN